MRSAIILSITGSAAAVPLGDVFNALFGRDPTPSPEHEFGFPPPFISGTGFPTGVFPTATGVLPTGIAPTGTNIFSMLPHGPIPTPGQGRGFKTLSIDYELAPTHAVVKKAKRQEPGTALPSFSLLDPSDTPAPGIPTETAIPSETAIPELPFPSETEAPTPSQTGGFPEPPFPFPTGTGGAPAPTGGFPFPTGGPSPTGGLPPFFPSTLATVTRGPRPTSVPELPEFPSDPEDQASWWEIIKEWLEQFGQGGNGGRN